MGVGVGSNWPDLTGDIPYVGNEQNQAMLQGALKHAREEGLSVDLRPIDVRAMPFPDGARSSRRVRLGVATNARKNGRAEESALEIARRRALCPRRDQRWGIRANQA